MHGSIQNVGAGYKQEARVVAVGWVGGPSLGDPEEGATASLSIRTSRRQDPEYGDGRTDNLCGWGLLWAKSIEHVVLSFLAKHIVLSFKELCNQIYRILSYFLLLLITFLSLGLLVIVQCPNTSITKNRTKVDF